MFLSSANLSRSLNNNVNVVNYNVFYFARIPYFSIPSIFDGITGFWSKCYAYSYQISVANTC